MADIEWNIDFYRGKRVLVTGHTGFKGSWLCYMLTKINAVVCGYALPSPTEPSLFSLCRLEREMTSVLGDVRDMDRLKKTFDSFKPEIVLHLAAQPIVRDSYTDPRYTYETNVMGTVNVLECVRTTDSVRSFLNVTTDKVYRNHEWEWGYRENDSLDGYDPYSNSKSCSELVTNCYKRSFFENDRIAVSTCRAGNVIGGGDFAKDRIIPDCIRAASEGRKIVVRNPRSTRPYQHVLEPLCAYLMVAAKQYEDSTYAGNYNVGPEDGDCVTTGELATLFCEAWGEGMSWINKSDGGPHEANFLKLDCSRIKNVFGWRSQWNIKDAVSKTVEWAKDMLAGNNIEACMDRQIGEYLNGENVNV